MRHPGMGDTGAGTQSAIYLPSQSLGPERDLLSCPREGPSTHSSDKLSLMHDIKNAQYCPGEVAHLVGASSYTPKGCRFVP